MKRLTDGELSIFCEQMGMTLGAGLPAVEGILVMQEDAQGQGSLDPELYEKLNQHLEETGVFWEALEVTGVFPEYLVHMARVGEETGNLDEVMRGLAAYYERQDAMAQDIRNAITYPLLMLGIMILVMLVIIIKVLPVFARVYEQMGSPLTGAAALLLRFGEFLGRWYGVALGLFFVAAVFVIWLFRSERGRKLFAKAADHFLGTRKIRDLLGSARFASGMSMAIRSGMDYGSAFDLVEMLLSGDEVMKKKVALCRQAEEEGASLSDAVNTAGIFGGLFARLFHVAERTGELPEALEKIAVQADEEVTERIYNFVSVLEPTMVIGLSVLVGGILLSVMVPLMNLLSSMG